MCDNALRADTHRLLTPWPPFGYTSSSGQNWPVAFFCPQRDYAGGAPFVDDTALGGGIMRPLFAILATWALACGGGLGASGGKIKDMHLEADPYALDFWSVALGSDVTRTVKLTHTGTEGVIVISDIRRAEGTSDEFSWDPLAQTELSAGESTNLVIHFRPVRGEKASGSIIITHNVPDTDYKTVIQVSAAGQVGDLTVVPPFDFGEVPQTELPRTMDAELKNFGTKPVMIDKIALKGIAGSPFALSDVVVTPAGAGLPYELKPGEAIGLVATFNLADVGCYEDERLFVYSGTDRYDFPVVGCVIGPKVVVSPGIVDFGYVKPGVTVTKDLTITNQGEFDLVVTDVLPFVGADPGLVVVGGPQASSPFKLAKNEERKVTVSWTPSLGYDPGEDRHVGFIHVISNDLGASPTSIEVLGDLDIPCIAPDPELVDFGFVAQGITTSRFLYISNDCHGDLTVSSLAIDKSADPLDEFSIVPDATFPVTSGSGPGVVPGFEVKAVEIRFKNKGPAEGCVTATLTISSDSPNAEKWPIALQACRSGTPTCKPVLVPATINFGTLAVGDSLVKTMKLKNTGTGNCTFSSLKVVDCSYSLMNPLMPNCPEPFQGTPSKLYTIDSGPNKGDLIGPGMELPINVRFNAAQVNGGLLGMVSESQAVLGVKVVDDNIPSSPKEVTIPSSNKANLIGSAGIPKLSVLPGEIKFGLVTFGCWSKTYNVCIYNSGSAPLTVSDISLAGCSPEFKLKNVPPLPLEVKPGVPQCFGAAFVPVQEGDQTCAVHIASNDKAAPNVAVKLSGKGTYEDEQTDEFVQSGGQSVDILFVIDDSGSMCSHQDLLAQNIDKFVATADVWKNDYHMGVVTVNVTDEKVAGKLNKGEKQPRYVIPGQGAQQLFQSYAKVGCDGGSDSQEAGFEPMQIALSAPLATDVGKPCSSDSDCKNDPNVCADPASCPYLCLDNPETPGKKTCGGWNKGFLRDDAKLEVIVLADEDDQSPAAPTFYIDFLRNIKGFYNVGWARLHAIVWQDSCGDPPVSQTVGKRYMMVAQETGGKIGEICSSDYGPVLNEIGKMVFTPKVQFFLSRLADPPTIVVKVNGALCKQGWTYDAPSNSVIFQENGPCMPKENDKIWIHYKTLCLQG